MLVRILTFLFCKALWSGSPDWNHTGVVVTHSKSEYSCVSLLTFCLYLYFSSVGLGVVRRTGGFGVMIWSKRVQVSTSEFKWDPPSPQSYMHMDLWALGPLGTGCSRGWIGTRIEQFDEKTIRSASQTFRLHVCRDRWYIYVSFLYLIIYAK